MADGVIVPAALALNPTIALSRKPLAEDAPAESPIEPQHLVQLRSNLKEVNRLVQIHSELTGEGPGRRRDVDILNKSAIVMTVACWESFVEDLAEGSFDFLLENADQPSVFPMRVLIAAAESLRTDPDKRRIWELAGDGWRTVLLKHRDLIVGSFLDGFHTPRASKIDQLFEQLLDRSKLSTEWRWHKNPNGVVLRQLDKLVTLRGDIAHRVSVGRYVKKTEVASAIDLVSALATISSNRMRSFLMEIAHKEPWPEYKYGSAH